MHEPLRLGSTMTLRNTHDTIIVRPRNLPKERGTIIGAEISNILISSLAPALRAKPSEENVCFDLSQVGWVSSAEIVTLACSIRALAERGVSCSIKLPDDTNSHLLWTLKSYRFPDALGAISQSDAWHKRIHFENYLPTKSELGELSDTRRVLPISWIDLKSFGYDKPPSNLYAEEPEFNPAYTRFIRAVLSRHGFVAEDAIDDFIRGVLREIGWNAVLHSNKGKPGAFAAFAGQIFPATNSMHFALADTGCGIASNLLDRYREAKKSGVVPAYERIYSCSETTAAVRYAIEPGSTSRKAQDFPSEYDMFSDRGLALVAEIVQETGYLTLLSSGGAINVGGKNQKRVEVKDLSKTFPWTCLYGSLGARSGERSRSTSAARADIEKEIENADVYPAAILLRRTRIATVGLIKRIRRQLCCNSKFAIVDVGFLDKSARNVENGIVTLVEAVEPDSLTILNVRSRRVSPVRIIRALKQVGIRMPLTIRIAVAGQSSLQEIRISLEHYDDDRGGSLEWRHIVLDDRLACQVHFRATSAFLEHSFGRDATRHGFYKGRVHLLSGNVTDRFFSLVAHGQADGGNSFLRWTDAFGRLLDTVLRGTEVASVKLLGFAASMRGVLGSLDKANPIRDQTYCLLSYDAPSKAELTEIIKSGDQVVLCTDVISSGSLLHEMVTLIRRIGASIIGIISLVDAREHPADTWETLFEPEVGGIPLYLGSSLRRRFNMAIEEKGFEYWVDPVSAVPMPMIQESEVNVKEVLATVELLDEAHSVTLGHFVSGLRHTSVRIDMFKLLARRDQVSAITLRKLQELLRKTDWTTFQPRVALVPAGIHRIDKLNTSIDSGGGRPSSEIYAEIVCESFPGHPQIISVPRTFEPGGQAKCATLGNIGVRHNLSDVLIVDDGISSGGTVRSLVHQAVRAGAERILVCALLARATQEELDQWALTSKVTDESSANTALVAVIHPLYLPIPFSGASDCAQCTTLNSIGSRISGRVSSKGGWKAIREDLTAPYEYSPSGSNELYVSTWVRVHSLSEIASRSVDGFEILKSVLSEIAGEIFASSHIKREAIVRLFLVEWRLLGRARLRQVIRRSVLDIVILQLKSAQTDDRRFIEALSLVRSMFPDDYIRTVMDTKHRIVCSEDVLKRVLFHVGTLSPLEWENKCADVLELLLEALLANPCLGAEIKRRHQHLIEQVAADLGKTSQEVDIAHKIRALKITLSGAVLVHDAIGPLTEVSEIDSGRVERFREDGYFGPLIKQMEASVIPAIEKELYPLLRGAGELLGLQLQYLKLSGEVQQTYFEIGHEPGVRSIENDLQSVLLGCRNIQSGFVIKNSLKVAKNAAVSILNNVLLPRSALRQVLNSLTSSTVSSILSVLENSLRGFVPDSELIVEPVSRDGAHAGDTRLLCPEPFVIQFVTLVKENLRKHVLDAAAIPSSLLRISVSVGFMTHGHRGYAVFRLANSGPPPEPGSGARFRSRLFVNKLEVVDGNFVPAEPGCNGFGAAASLRLRIYDGAANEDTDR